MARKNKNTIHNQIDIDNGDIQNEDIIERNEIIESENQELEENLEIINENKTPELENQELDTKEPIENLEIINEDKIEVKKPKRTIESLSRDEYRLYLRTGKMPI